MATFTSLPSGRTRAQIRRPGQKSISKTLETLREAQKWARGIEAELDRGTPAAAASASDLAIASIVGSYRTMRGKMGKPVEPTSSTEYMLQHIEQDLGDARIADLTPARLMTWARLRADDGASPATFNLEFSLLGTVLRHTASYLNVAFPDVVGAARPMLYYAELIGAPNRRTREPSEDEATRVIEWIEADSRYGKRVADAIRVGGIAGLRRGELARILRTQLDPHARAVLVTKRKHPRRRLMRDEWVPLFGEAWDIANAQPPVEGDNRIFPISREKMTDSVTAATRALGIPNLHLNDFRHAANNKLRVLGFNREERKAVLGHLSDKVHDIYTHVKPEQLQARYDELRGSQPRPLCQPEASDHPAGAIENRPAGVGS